MNSFGTSQQLTTDVATCISTTTTGQVSTAIGQTGRRGRGRPPRRPIAARLHDVSVTTGNDTVPPCMQQHSAASAPAGSCVITQSQHSAASSESARRHSAVTFDSCSAITSIRNCPAVTTTTHGPPSAQPTVKESVAAITKATVTADKPVCVGDRPVVTTTTATTTAITTTTTTTHDVATVNDVSQSDKPLCPGDCAMLWLAGDTTTAAAAAADDDDMAATKPMLLPPSSYFHLVPLITPPTAALYPTCIEPATMYVDMATVGMATMLGGVAADGSVHGNHSLPAMATADGVVMEMPVFGGHCLMSVDDDEDDDDNATMAVANPLGWSVYNCLTDSCLEPLSTPVSSCGLVQQPSNTYLIDLDITSNSSNTQSKPAYSATADNPLGWSVAVAGGHCYSSASTAGNLCDPNPDNPATDNLLPVNSVGGPLTLPAQSGQQRSCHDEDDTTTTAATDDNDDNMKGIELSSAASRPDVVSSNIPRSHAGAAVTTTPCSCSSCGAAGSLGCSSSCCNTSAGSCSSIRGASVTCSGCGSSCSCSVSSSSCSGCSSSVSSSGRQQQHQSRDAADDCNDMNELHDDDEDNDDET